MNTQILSKAIEMMEKNQFDDFTKSKVLEYIEIHDAMYGDIIDTTDVIERIGQNLTKSILFKQPRTSGEMTRLGGYYSGNKSITFFETNINDDVLFHEIDHSATSDLSSMPDFESDYAWTNEGMEKIRNEGYRYYTGIEVIEQMPNKSETCIGKNLNEGITEIKTLDYAKFRDIQATKSGYNNNCNMAEQIGCLIGRDNLIKKHFYNDIDGINDELEKYGINLYEIDELSNKFAGDYMQRTINIGSGKIDTEKENKYKIEFQNKMTLGFIAKRCQELGITRNEYANLTRKQKKQEYIHLQEFEKFKLCDCPELNQLKAQLQPRSFLESIKGLFKKKNQRLPEGKILEEIDDHLEEKPKTHSWNLNNWGIDAEKIRTESSQLAEEYEEENKNTIEDKKQEISVENQIGD